jgi:alpha-L-rhamnosidase
MKKTSLILFFSILFFAAFAQSEIKPINWNAVERLAANQPDSIRALVERLVACIERENVTDRGVRCPPYSLMTGFITTAWISRVLSDGGRSDVAYRLLQQEDYPSWLYPVTQGATTIWERLNSYTHTDGFGGNNSMNSFNHYSLGAVLEWMMGSQLGITPDAEEAGYQHFILQPIPGGTFTEAGGSYDSPYGVIRSAWTREDGVLSCYDVTVPANTSADLYLPASGEVTLTEGVSGGEREVHNGIDSTKFVLLSGSYHFEVKDGAITVTAKPAETGR